MVSLEREAHSSYDHMMSLVQSYYTVLTKWSSRINLTAITNQDEFQIKHVDDSLSALIFLENAKKMIDLGSGAGFPGIILKIYSPELAVTLLDSTRKKVSFCEEVIRTLGLKGIRAVWGRAEDEGVRQGLGSYDIVISRATWELSNYLDIAKDYLSDGGKIIAMKGGRWSQEIDGAAEALKKNNLRIDGVHEYKLKTGDQRALVIVKKRSK